MAVYRTLHPVFPASTSPRAAFSAVAGDRGRDDGGDLCGQSTHGNFEQTNSGHGYCVAETSLGALCNLEGFLHWEIAVQDAVLRHQQVPIVMGLSYHYHKCSQIVGGLFVSSGFSSQHWNSS